MDQSPDHRIEYAADGKRDGEKIQRHGEGHIAFDRNHHPPGEGDQMGEFLYFVVHQGDIRRIHGNVASDAAHGDAHLRFFQGGRVVDAVADHADRAARILIFADGLQLVLRKAVRTHRADLKLRGDGFRRVFMVARQKDRLRPHFGKRADHVRAVLPQRIG